MFFPAFFASVEWEVSLILSLIGGFFAFSLAASSVYIMNDWFDAPVDRLHPEKKNRPIASGKIGSEKVFKLVLLFLGAAILLGGIINIKFAMILLGYFGINLAYSAGLKNFPVLDVMIISIGFIIRIISGGMVADVPLSFWIIIVTFFLALFLAFAKRRHDYLLFQLEGKETRKSISLYSMPMINVGIVISSFLTLLFYLLYTLSSSIQDRIGNMVPITTIFVALGLLRYYWLIYKKNVSGKPTQVLYDDRLLQLVIVLWVVSFGVIIYGG